MDSLALFAAAPPNKLWYAIPLIVTISLVYAATRHEQLRPMLRRALRVALLVTGAMAVLVVLLEFMSWWT
jgi:hypothetical protein